MERITEHITRIWIPFEGVETSAFVVVTNKGAAILDCGASADDVARYILPFLVEKSIVPSLLFASHTHSDHAGGLPALAEHFPDARIALYDRARLSVYPEERYQPLADGDLLLGCLRVLHTSGHSADAVSIFDERTRTLLTFDATQGFGVGRFGSGISDVLRYLASLDRMASLGAEHLAAAHDYTPIGTTAHGRDAVLRYFDGCREAVADIRSFVAERLSLSPEAISKQYITAHPERPPLTPWSVQNFIKYISLS